MPGMGTLDDRQLSAILTYVRGAWGHRGRTDSARNRRQDPVEFARTCRAVDTGRALGAGPPGVAVRRTLSPPEGSCLIQRLYTFHQLAQFVFLVLGQRGLKHPTFAGKGLEPFENLVGG